LVILDELVKKYPELDMCRGDILQAFELLKTTYAGGGKLLVCGNGGSAADSEHIVGELMKGYLQKRPLSVEEITGFQAVSPETGTYLAHHLQGALPAISLVSQVALNTAFANDVSADLVFAQQVYGYGRPGDCLWALSTSGNAQNVLFGLQTARVKGLHTLGLTGSSGGKMAAWCDVTIRVPWDETPAIQERHLPVIHVLCALLEEEFFP
jgi:D-sedoheptulose 7-phosphate isomerase